MKMSTRKSILIVFTVLLLSSILVVPTQAQENENLLYLTNLLDDGEIRDSEALIDGDGNLHTFFVVKNINGTRLIHLYYEDGEAVFNVLIQYAQGVDLLTSYANGTKIGLIYSLTSGLGDKTFRVYEKEGSTDLDISLFTVSSSLDTWYITFYKFIYSNGVVHGFHNQYWGGDNQFMNITHYYGVPGGLISYESYFIGLDSTKDVLDIAIDRYDNYWYVYELRQDDFGIGVGLLDDEFFAPTTFDTRTFSGVIYDVPEFVVLPCNPADGLLSFTFINPYRLFWGYFNGTYISEYSQSTFYEHPEDIEFNIDATASVIIVVDVLDDDIVNFYKFTRTGENWQIQNLPSEEKISFEQYSIYLQATNFVILFSTVIETEPYEPDGPLSYRDKTGLALYSFSDLILETELIIESLEVYNPITEFFITKWWVVLIIAIVLAIIGLIIGISIRRRREDIKDFLTDTQVGEGHSKFVLFFLNTWRLIRNGISTVFTIWLSNRKRSILTLAGFVITGYLLSSAVIIAQSEESAMIKAFNRSFPLASDGEISAKLETSFITGNFSGMDSSYAEDAKDEILDLYHGLTVDDYIADLNSGYKTILRVYKFIGSSDRSFVSLPQDSDAFLNSMIIEGRIPHNETEVIVEYSTFNSLGIEVNETMTVGAWAERWIGWGTYPTDEQDYKTNCTVVGVYKRISVGQARRFADHLGSPYDIYTLASEGADIITKNNNFFEILSRANKMHLDMWGYYQLLMNFDNFRITDRAALVEEQEDMQQRIYTFSFDPSSTISTLVENQFDETESTELKLFFESFNNYYLNNMARLLIFAIPAILLSIFMVFESSDLFSSSYEQEMEILRNRGISTGRLFWTYIVIRLAEIILASLVSFGIAIGTAIPLIKIDGFITFTNQDTHLVVGNIPAILSIVAGILVLVSIPRILILVRRKKTIEKAPRISRRKIQKDKDPTFDIPKDQAEKEGKKTAGESLADGYTDKETETTLGSIINFVAKSGLLSWRDIFFLGLGIGLFYYFFNRTFVAYSASAVGDFTLFLFLTIAGAIFTLIGGLPFIVKILGLLQKSFTALAWRMKKSRFSFSLSEIGKDIKHFENITLIFLLVILIIVPVLVVPYSKETTLTDQAYFVNGTDIKISNWDDVDLLTTEDLDLIPQIQSYTNVREYTLYGGTYDYVRMLVINVTDFMRTMRVPTEGVSTLDWNLVATLDEDNVVMSRAMRLEFGLPIGAEMEFMDILFNVHELTVIGEFNLFPAFYNSYDEYNNEYLMVVSTEAFEILDPMITTRLKLKDEMYIRTYYEKDTGVVLDKLFDIQQGLITRTVADVKYTLKTPLYNIFIIEMLLSLFVATGVLIFSTFTTAIKILEKRVIKHDIMKKMGINSTRITTMSTVQTMLAAILPALIIGAGVGFSVISPTLQQLNYGSAPYQFYINYPLIWIVVLFVGIPVLIYMSLNYFLKREFSKYAPTMME